MTTLLKSLLRKFLISTFLLSTALMIVQFLLPLPYSLARNGAYVVAVIIMALLIYQFYFRRLSDFETKKKFRYAGTVFPSIVLIIALIALPVIAVNLVDVSTRQIQTLNTPDEMDEQTSDYVRFNTLNTLPNGLESEKYFWQSKEGKYSNHVQEHAEVTYYLPVASSGNDSLPVYWIKWRYEAWSHYDIDAQQIEKFRSDFLRTSAGRMANMRMDSVFYFSHQQVPSNKLPDTRHKSDNRAITILIPNLEAPVDEAKDYLIFLIGSWVILFLLFMLAVSNLKPISESGGSAQSVLRT